MGRDSATRSAYEVRTTFSFFFFLFRNFESLPLFLSALSAVVAPLRLSPQERSQLVQEVIPWAISTARNSVFLMNVYYERHLTESLVDLQRQLRITPPKFSFDLKADPHSDVYKTASQTRM
jgi:hypothetical protein